MSPLEQQLRRWEAAGLISGEDASRIRAFEAPPDLATRLSRWERAGLLQPETSERILAFERQEPRAVSARPGVVEAIVYLGVAVIAVGVFALAQVNWAHLPSLVRVAVPGVPGLLALPVGRGLLNAPQAGLRRGGAVSWLLALVLITAAVAVACVEGGWWKDDDILLVTAVAGLGVAIALWMYARTDAQVVGLAAAAGLVTVAVASRFDRENVGFAGGFTLLLFGALGVALVKGNILAPKASAHLFGTLACGAGAIFLAAGASSHASGDNAGLAYGLTLFALSLAGLLLTEAGVFAPLSLARVGSGVGLVVGGLVAGLDPAPPPGELVSIVAGVILLLASLRTGALLYLGFATVAVFIGLVTPIVRHIEDPTLMSLALIAVGLLVLGGVALIVRRRPWARRHRGDGRKASSPRPPATGHALR